MTNRERLQMMNRQRVRAMAPDEFIKWWDTTVKEPVTVVEIPKPVKAPMFAPPVEVPVEATPERELVPVRVRPQEPQRRL